MSQRKYTGLNTNPWPKLVDHYNHVCLGKDQFVKFWETNPEDESPSYDTWHQYTLQDMSAGYFIHNLMSVISGHQLVRNENVWFPTEGKEARRSRFLAR